MSAYFTKICNAVAVAEIKCMFVVSAFFSFKFYYYYYYYFI